MKKAIHFRGLNGIRALAAIAVLISHVMGDLSHFGLNSLEKSLTLASFGVTMFFTLSGFLITFLLLKEKEKTEREDINIINFYVRRVLRIWPLYFLYLVICIVVYAFFSIDYDRNQLFFYTFLLANVPFVLDQSLPYLAHLWSIAVEEQFYLFWPWIAKVKQKKLLRNSIILLFILLIVKYLFYLVNYMHNVEIPIIAITVTRFYCMIIGCIAAILYYQKSRIIDYLSSIYFSIFCWVILFLALINRFHISSLLIDHELISIITVGIIFTQINRKNYIIDLDSKPFNFIGKISYGIYVYHPLVIFFFVRYFGFFRYDVWYNYILMVFLILIITILISYISFVFFERYFIKMKDKYSSVKSRA